MRELRPTLLAALLVAGCSDAADDAPDKPGYDAKIDLDTAGSDGRDGRDGGTPLVDAVAEPSSDADAAKSDAPLPPPPPKDAMGATVLSGGVIFRVWAPAATTVSVVGAFASAPVVMSSEGKGVFAVRVDGAKAGDRYHFTLATTSGTLTRLDPAARQLDTSGASVECVVVDPAAFAWKTGPFTPKPRNQTVIYELHVGSFNCPSGTAGCTFAGAAARLADVADLGVDAVELMPVNVHGSGRGWGYGPQLYDAPHTNYGTADDFRAFVDAAHGLSVAVMLDVVWNHYDGYAKAPLRCFDGNCPGSSKGIYFFDDAAYRDTPWGPRPDFSRPEVATHIVESTAMWMRESRVDGYRWDSVSNIRALDGAGTVPGGVEVLRAANDAARAMLPNAILVAEDLKGEAKVSADTASGGLGFGAQWDAGFQSAISGAVIPYDDASRNLFAVRDALKGSYNGDPFQRVLFTEDHDTVGNGGARLPSKIDAADPTSVAARRRSMLAAAVLFTAPGIPMLFQGQEMLEAGTFPSTPDPLDWSHRTAQAKIVAYYRDLIALRRNLGGVSGGLLGANVDVFHLNDGAKVMAYRRWDKGGDDVVVLANFSLKPFTTYELGLPAAGPWKVRLSSDDVKYGADFGTTSVADVVTKPIARDGLPNTGAVSLAGYAVVVLTR